MYPADEYHLELAVTWNKHHPYPNPATVMNLDLACAEGLGDDDKVRVTRMHSLNEAAVLGLEIIVEDLDQNVLGNYAYEDIGNVGRVMLLKELDFGPIE